MAYVKPSIEDKDYTEEDTPVEIGMNAFGKAVLLALVLVVIAIGVSAGGLRGEFLPGDDVRIVNNPSLRGWGGLKHIWLRPNQFPEFSPASYSMFVVEARLWGTNAPRSPAGFRFINAMLHAATVVALWHLLARLRIPGAFAAAALFAAHPANMFSVSWISQRSMILGSLFFFLTLIVYLRLIGLNRQPTRLHRIWKMPESPAALWFLTIALLALTITASPALAALVAPIALVLVWWDRGRVSSADWRKITPLLAVSLLIFAAAVLLNFRAAINGFALPDCPIWYRPIAAIEQIIFYAAAVVAPVQLRFAYQPFGVFDLRAILSLAIAAVMIVGAVATNRFYNRGPAAAMILFVLLLLPALLYGNSADLFGGWVGVHRVYAASAPLLVLVTTAIAQLLPPRLEPRAAVTTVAVVTVATGGFLSAREHQTSERLWTATLAGDPDNIIAMLELGDRAMQQGRSDPAIRDAGFPEARRFFDNAVRADPQNVAAICRSAGLFEAIGEHERAMNGYQRAVQIDPNNFEANFGLARALSLGTGSAAAMRQYQVALQIKPDDPDVLTSLGSLHIARGEFDLAEAAYRKAISVDPRNIRARVNLASYLGFQKGDPNAAEQEMLAVLAIDPHNFEVFMNGGTLMAKLAGEAKTSQGRLGWFEKAATMFRRAIELRDSSADAYSNRAMALIGMSNSDDQKMTPDDKRSLLGEAEFLFEQAALRAPGNLEHKRNAGIVSQMREALAPPKP